MLTLNGSEGSIKYGYRKAARFTAWRYERAAGDGAGTISGTVEAVDEFSLSQSPLSVVVTVGRTVGRWPVVSLVREGPRVTVTVGPRVKES